MLAVSYRNAQPQLTMNTESSPESRVDQTDNFHALFKCLDRLVLKVMKHAAEL